VQASWERIQTQVREAGAVAAVAASPESVRHLAGVHFPSQIMIRRRFAFVIIPAEGTPSLLVQAVLAETARGQGTIPRVATYVTEPIEGLAGLLVQERIDHGDLLLELDFLPASDAADLQARLRTARVVDAQELFRAARETRWGAEVTEIRECALTAERAIQTAFAMAADGGVTEQQVHGRMQETLTTLGSATIPFLTLSSGPERTCLTHAHPGKRMIQRGDLLLVDLVGFFGGLYTDIARTAVVGEASSAQRAMYRRVRAAQRDVLASIRPGMAAGDVYEHFRRAAGVHGLSFVYRYVGHSTGYQVVEEPVLTTGNTRLLRAGMVLCVEVKDVVQGVGGVHVEDMVHLTDAGPEVWTDLMAADDIPEVR
jgi:Xaa-Pro aminopeptidase